MEKSEIIVLDMSGILDAETMHEYLSKKLDFPGFYGFNFDAFWDSITDEDQSYMPDVLRVEGLGELERNIPDEYSKFLECLKDYEKYYPERQGILFQR